MTFLASATQRSLVLLQKNQKQFELNILQNRYVRYSKAVADMDAENGLLGEDAPDLDQNPYYVSISKESERLEAEVEQLRMFIENVLTNQLDSLKNVVNNGVKTSCGLTYSGGGGS